MLMQGMIDRRKWFWLDWIMLGLYTFWFFVNLVFLYFEPTASDFRPLWAYTVALFLCYVVPLIFWRPGYIHKIGFPAAVFLTSHTLSLYTSWNANEYMNLGSLPVLMIGYLSHRKTWWMNFIIICVVAPTLIYSVVDNKSFLSFVGNVVNDCFIFGFGYTLYRIHDSHQRMKSLLEENQRQYALIQEQNNTLEQYSKQVERITLLEERNRMARELHDTVGHTFTSVIMGMDAVSYLIETAPSKAAERLDKLREVTRNGLEEVRKSIHQMAPHDMDELLSVQLSRLMNEFSVHTGTQIRFHKDGVEPELAKQAKLTLIRCLQESLTNAKRHGRANHIEVSLMFMIDQVILIVEDDGIGTDELCEGFGIRAMKERLYSLNGSIHLHSKSGEGTTMTCKIPLKG